MATANATGAAGTPPASNGQTMTLAEKVYAVIGDEHAMYMETSGIPRMAPGFSPTYLEDTCTDWGFAAGVAFAIARSEGPWEDNQSVAARALPAAIEAFERWACAPGQRGFEKFAPDTRLAKLRIASNLTLEEVTDKWPGFVDEPTVLGWERDPSSVPHDAAVTLAEIYGGVTVEYLLEREATS
jgi:hypothetical protein